MFSKKATKIHEIFTVDLTVTTYCQIDGEDFVNFMAFSENVNFNKVWNIMVLPSNFLHRLEVCMDISGPLNHDIAMCKLRSLI